MEAFERVERVVVLEASLDEVWAALTRPEHLSTWLGAETELDVRPGGRGSARRPDGAVRRIRVEAVEPRRRLAFRWWPFEGEGAPPVGLSTKVEFLLESAGGRTRLTVTERKPPEARTRSATEPLASLTAGGRG